MNSYKKNKDNSFAIIDNRPMFSAGLKRSIQSITSHDEVSEYGSFNELSWDNPQIKYTSFFIKVGSSPFNTMVKNIRKLKSSNKSCKIILYDYQLSINYIIAFFGEKINAYLPDNFDENELRECLISIDANRLYINNQIAMQLLKIKPSRGVNKNIRLTVTETKVADFLVQGMRPSLIAKEMDRKISTISTIKSNIFKKTNVDNIIDLRVVMDSAAMGFSI
ncbi:LuxR C-terminal-related transcriptional regulator [Dyadobacter sp. LHD-138]|uniref:response regulator transcription factor n=1 Tax=Dyadobacter sp. LHD-138 TaxID=3071413 RepID=UPI0027E01962|nr:LuxR C-terminal-related transcriptional regulator [Dyadobacter sp. LHD-138]MDQ6482133.1 LuxR C-terminal-related transcriptional regulator [Dyadobacter sp. LHD-138]